MRERIPFEERTVVAFGGDVLQRRRWDGSTDAFSEGNISTAIKFAADVCPKELIVTHGRSRSQWEELWRENIQKGYCFTPDEVARAVQIKVGGIMKNAIADDYLRYWRDVFVHETRVKIDPEHSSFTELVGVGPWATRSSHMRRGIDYRTLGKNPSGNGLWRERFPLLMPQNVLEKETIIAGVEARAEGSNNPKNIVVCGGGGGVPFFEKNGEYVPVRRKVMIDNFLTSAMIANFLKARVLAIITNEDGIYENYGTKNQKLIPKMTAEEAFQRIELNENGAGSMNLKIRAVAVFVRKLTGRVGVITSLENLERYAMAKRHADQNGLCCSYDFLKHATLVTS